MISRIVKVVLLSNPLSKEGRALLLSIISGIFLILHGLVHLLYFGQSARRFELQPGMVWPDGSWVFAGPFGNEATRILASVACVLAAIGFVAGGIAIFATQAWWRPVILGSAAFSVVIFILLWDGQPHALANKGLLGILINLAILVALLVFRWPRLGF